MVTLLAQHVAGALDVGGAKLAIAGRARAGPQQSLALQEAQLGDADVGELLLQESDHFPDDQRPPVAHAPRATTRWKRPMITSSPGNSSARSARLPLTYVPLVEPRSSNQRRPAPD